MTENAPPKPSLERRLFLGLARAAALGLAELGDLLRERDLTPAQYEALRSLRDAGAPLSCKAILGSLPGRLPDLTRLLDRLGDRGLVTRERGAAADRRISLARITPAGLALLAALDRQVLGLHKRQFAGLSIEERYRLGELLARLHS